MSRSDHNKAKKYPSSLARRALRSRGVHYEKAWKRGVPAKPVNKATHKHALEAQFRETAKLRKEKETERRAVAVVRRAAQKARRKQRD